MKRKVAELEGALLDAAVSEIESGPFGLPNAYSTDWQFGGPIIEREQIVVSPTEYDDRSEPWFAGVEGCQLHRGQDAVLSYGAHATGRTPLIAAMRAFVASKFGEEVELP